MTMLPFWTRIIEGTVGASAGEYGGGGVSVVEMLKARLFGSETVDDANERKLDDLVLAPPSYDGASDADESRRGAFSVGSGRPYSE